MKLLATLATVALSFDPLECIEDGHCWPGSNDNVAPADYTFNTCGMQIHEDSGFKESMVNRTCTWSGPNVRHVYAGNGAFITGENSFTGYEGISGDVNLVVFFDQECLDEECTLDNSSYPEPNAKCFDFSVNCVDNGSAIQGAYLMETVNDHRQATGTNYNLQVVGAQGMSGLTISLFDRDNAEWRPSQNKTTVPFGTVETNGNIITVANDGHTPFGELFQVFIVDDGLNDKTKPLDLWKSSVQVW